MNSGSVLWKQYIMQMCYDLPEPFLWLEIQHQSKAAALKRLLVSGCKWELNTFVTSK